MGDAIDPLAASVQQSPILTLIAAVILLAFCALSIAFRRQQRRLAAMKTQLDNLSRAIDSLRAAHEGLVVRFMNNRSRSRKAAKSSGPSSALGETMTSSMAPKQPDEKSNGSTLEVASPKIFAE